MAIGNKWKALAAVGGTLIATAAIATTFHMQAQAKTDQSAYKRHKILACGPVANGFECEKIRPVFAK